MKKNINLKLTLVLLLLLFPAIFYAKNSFYILNRYGILIRVDPASGFIPKYAKNKGPRLDEVPKEIDAETFEKYISEIITDENDRLILTDSYEKVEEGNKYVLKSEKDNISDLSKIRAVLLKYNKDNEIKNDLGEYGMPMPHKFPRVFEAKSKPYFDVHIAWGVKFDNFTINNGETKLGNMIFGFSINLANFIMPSLEIMLKYNFYLPDYPVEPYIGGLIYGGFMDGFPIGFNVIGGVDLFPMHYEDVAENRNLFLNGELRIGPVINVPIYYDTGLNTEGIWKKIGILIDGGFYTGIGYIFH